jgi:hypothetical protein
MLRGHAMPQERWRHTIHRRNITDRSASTSRTNTCRHFLHLGNKNDLASDLPQRHGIHRLRRFLQTVASLSSHRVCMHAGMEEEAVAHCIGYSSESLPEQAAPPNPPPPSLSLLCSVLVSFSVSVSVSLSVSLAVSVCLSRTHARRNHTHTHQRTHIHTHAQAHARTRARAHTHTHTIPLYVCPLYEYITCRFC